MKHSLLPLLIVLAALAPWAAHGATSSVDSLQAVLDEEAAPVAYIEPEEDILDYSDYTVKGYTLSFGGGSFSGATFLDLQPLADRTTFPLNTGEELGAGDVLGFDGLPLPESRQRDQDGFYLFDTAQKTIESGPSFSGRVGINVAENFHLNVLGSFATGKGIISMVYRGETNDELTQDQRYSVINPADVDKWEDDIAVIKGGLGLMYDAVPATFWGLTPHLGFGLGGVINSFSHLEDKTALYLEGTFALSHKLMRNMDVFGQVDVTTFAFDVDELGYSEMVNYKTFSIGLTWFADVLPTGVRAAHEAAKDR